MSEQPDIALFDERVSWKVPTLLNNDWVAISVARSLNPQLPKPLFSSAYGCPLCLWAGGREPQVGRLAEEELRRYFEAYAEVGATCSLTPSRLDAGEHLGDAYGNMLLDLADEYGGCAIVADERLARHIRATHPALELVASNNRVVLDHAEGFFGLSEKDYYLRLLELYDAVVVRCEALLEGGIAEELVDVADRIELIVNQTCVRDCPDAAAHIRGMQRAICAFEKGSPIAFPTCSQSHERGGTALPKVCVPNERRHELADMGFCRFKLTGRNTTPTKTIGLVLQSILDERCDLISLDVTRPIAVSASLMERLGADDRMKTMLPREPQPSDG